MLAFTKSSGLPSDEVRSSLPTYDYSRLAQTGYFYKPTDWKNMEITIYVKVLSASGGGDEISLVSRSVETYAQTCKKDVVAHRITIILTLQMGNSNSKKRCGT